MSEEEFPEYRVSNAKEIFKTNRSDGCGFEKGVASLLPLAYIEDCPGASGSSQSPIISDDFTSTMPYGNANKNACGKPKCVEKKVNGENQRIYV